MRNKLANGGWRRARSAALACVCLALAFPASAGAVTILLGPPNLAAEDPFASCDALTPEFCTAKTFIPTALPEPGATLVAPADGTITSWRVRGAPPTKLRLRIVKALPDGQFNAVGSSGKAGVSDGVGENQVAIGIHAGDQLGINLENAPLASVPSKLAGNANAPGAAWSAYPSGLPDGATAPPSLTGSGSEPLFNATVVLAKPTLFSLSSTQGFETGGDIVVINGVHLAIASSVTFGGVPARILVAGNNQAMVATPAHAPGTVDVKLTTAGGSSDDSAVARYTYTAVPPPVPDTTAPKLSDFSISPIAFRAKKGAKLSFKSSEPAALELRVLRKPPGNRGRLKPLAGSIAAKANAGPNTLHFAGRFNGKRLKVGRYRLVVVAEDTAHNRSKALRRTFKIIP